MGVFATRSPNRPNPIGLSCVKLEAVEYGTPDGAVIRVSGIDMMDGTPVYDIKPYLPHADCQPDALGGFSADVTGQRVEVQADDALLAKLPADKRDGLIALLKEDPRPSYQNDPERIYGFPYAGFEVTFTVDGTLLTVRDIRKLK